MGASILWEPVSPHPVTSLPFDAPEAFFKVLAKAATCEGQSQFDIGRSALLYLKGYSDAMGDNRNKRGIDAVIRAIEENGEITIWKEY